MAEAAAPDASTIAPVDTRARGELDLVGLTSLLLRHVRFILATGAVFFVLTAIFTLVVKPRFASTATVIIPQQNAAAAALKAQLSAAVPLDLAAGGYELYADIFKSRAVRDRVINNLGLMSVYKVNKRSDAEVILADRTVIDVAREGTITLTVQDTDPNRAAQIANEYVKQLETVNSGLVLTSVGQERLYLERELAKEKEQLEAAEADLARTQEGMRGLPPIAEATAGLTAVEETRAELRSSEVKLAALLTGETDANPEVVRTRSEIVRLTGELAAMQHGQGSDTEGTPISKVPQQTLEYGRSQREVRFHETLLELLFKQFEEAKQVEAKDPTIVQVLDVAVPADRKAWPPRTLYCLIGFVVGMFVAAFFVLLRAFFRQLATAPLNRAGIVDNPAIVRQPRALEALDANQFDCRRTASLTAKESDHETCSHPVCRLHVHFLV